MGGLSGKGWDSGGWDMGGDAGWGTYDIIIRYISENRVIVSSVID